MRFFLALLLALSSATLQGAYLRSHHIDKEEWKEVKPYLLPEEHPMKSQLDKIFRKNRVTLSLKAMKKAGFMTPKPQKTTRLIVTRHPQLKGLIIKAYLDSQKAYKNKRESTFWIMRIKGAQAIAQLISERGWQETFKVPKKWIYPLPSRPAPPSVFQRVNFILVEEDMEIVNEKTNRELWKSSSVTKEQLGGLFTIIETIGLYDCCKTDNIPFCQDGKIAFVDTQTHGKWPIPYKRLAPFLSADSKHYWLKLAEQARNTP